MKESLFITLLLFSFFARSQNLVTNPGFEEINDCYGSTSLLGFDVFEWSGCMGWSNPIKSSSDLFCSPPASLGFTYQWPRSGSNMVGIVVNAGTIQNYREYLQNELIDELEQNVTYDIEFYVSGSYTSCVTNQFGVKFFMEEYEDTSALWLTDYIPDAVNNIYDYQIDTLNWQKIEMKYKAIGGERFFIVGNFQDSLTMTYNEPCDTSFWNGIVQAGDYIFMDDFTIKKTAPNVTIPNVFTPNGDGLNDEFRIEVENCNDWELVILNRWGNRIATCIPDYPFWKGENANEGSYFYILKSVDCDIQKHGFFQLIR